MEVRLEKPVEAGAEALPRRDRGSCRGGEDMEGGSVFHVSIFVSQGRKNTGKREENKKKKAKGETFFSNKCACFVGWLALCFCVRLCMPVMIYSAVCLNKLNFQTLSASGCINA